MNLLKRAIQIFLCILLAALLFRGPVFRYLVDYQAIGQRSSFPATNDKLIEYFNTSVGKQTNLDVQDIINLALSLTSKHLHFTSSRSENDPNRLIRTKDANCIGYATFFATACNYLLKKNGLAHAWVAKPQIGQLYFWGINVHPYFDSPFFRDHDFVIIENKATGEVFAVDPTIHDYLWINSITFKKK